MLTTKGRDFVRYALKPPSMYDRDNFLHTVANKMAGGTKMRTTKLNIFNFLDDRRSTYIKTGLSDVYLTPMIITWLKSNKFTEFTPEQAALMTAQMRGQSVMACATPGTGKTLASALAICHKFMHSTVSTRCHTLYLAPNYQAANGMGKLIRSIAGTGDTIVRVINDAEDISNDVDGLSECPPHVLIGTVSGISMLVNKAIDVFGIKLRKLVDTLIVDDVDCVLEQNGGLELIEKLYRRAREEISAQLIFLSATIDSEAQRRFNLLTKNETNVFRLCDSHFEYALPPSASFYLYCNHNIIKEQLLLRLLQNIQWIKGIQFRPLIITEGPYHSLLLERLFRANERLVKNDSIISSNTLLEAHVAEHQREMKSIMNSEFQAAITPLSEHIRITDSSSIRGVNYQGISDVFLMSVPSSKNLVHAAGKAARFGVLGDVNIIFSPKEAKAMHELCEVYDVPFKVSCFE